jgi:hypothetical protein
MRPTSYIKRFFSLQQNVVGGYETIHITSHTKKTVRETILEMNFQSDRLWFETYKKDPPTTFWIFLKAEFP